MNRTVRRLVGFAGPKRPTSPLAPGRMMRNKLLLSCGIAAAVLYIASDILATLRAAGYRYTDQTISELSAIDTPTRPLLVLVGILYSLLVIAFGVGVWGAAGRNRALRVLGGLLVGGGVLGFVWPFTPMHQREALAAGGGSLTDTMHLVMAAVTSLFFLLEMGFGAAALGKWFRRYSIGTILVLVVFGTLTSLQAGAVEMNEPTPWLGVLERINVYASMLWLALLAGSLLRIQDTSAARPLGRPTVTPRMLPR
jgi:hypothetical protein